MAQAIAGLGSSILGGIFGGKGQSAAAKAQANALKQALSNQQNQQVATQTSLAPWISNGQSALTAVGNLLGPGSGLNSTGASPEQQVAYLASIPTGDTAQQVEAYLNANKSASPQDQLAGLEKIVGPHAMAALQAYQADNPYVPGQTGVTASQLEQNWIDALKASPAFTSQYNTGADTILQNAAATGGIRGGNTQNSLAQFGSSLLAQVIQNQLANLSGVSSGGANAAMGLGQIGQNNANSQSNLYGQLGGAQGVQAASGDNMIAGVFNKLAGSLNPGGSLGNFFGGGGGGNSGVSSFGNNAINSMGLMPMNF